MNSLPPLGPLPHGLKVPAYRSSFFLPSYMWIVSYSLGCSKVFLQFPVSFQWECSTFRCILYIQAPYPLTLPSWLIALSTLFPQKCLKIAYILHISGLVYINLNHFVFFILSKKIIFNSKKMTISRQTWCLIVHFSSSVSLVSYYDYLFLHGAQHSSFLYYGLATIVRVF